MGTQRKLSYLEPIITIQPDSGRRYLSSLRRRSDACRLDYQIRPASPGYCDMLVSRGPSPPGMDTDPVG